MHRASWIVLITLAAAGCDEGTPGSAPLGSSRQVGDTTFVFSSAPERGTASLREVSRIGMVEGPPEYLLGASPTFTVGPDGSLFVADRGTLRHYDADGTYVRTIARRGEGPGEMTSVGGIDISADGLVAALDRGNRRVNVFSSDGILVREMRLGTSQSAGVAPYGRDALRWDDRGELLARTPSAPTGVGYTARRAAETAVRPPDRPRRSRGHRVPPDSSLGGLRTPTPGIFRGVHGGQPPS